MNSRSTLIVSVIFLSVLLHACPSQSCLKKIRALIRKKENAAQEKPAELAHQDESFIKYSHGRSNNFYIEIRQTPNRTFVVRELDHPPIAMNQVTGSDFKDTITKKPNAEHFNSNRTTGDSNQTTPVVTATKSPPPPPPPKPMIKEVKAEMTEEEEEEEILSPEDENVRREWGGNCTVKDWERCNKIRQIVVLDVINNQFQRKNLELDCLLEPILCLTNGWTSNRCHILCMAAQCNKGLFFDWDGTVDFEGPCRYRK